jgi:hypothetical protein
MSKSLLKMIFLPKKMLSDVFIFSYFRSKINSQNRELVFLQCVLFIIDLNFMQLSAHQENDGTNLTCISKMQVVGYM